MQNSFNWKSLKGGSSNYFINLCIKYHSSGEGDTGDVWKVVCSGMAWARDESVSFKHVDTGVFLGVSGRTFGRPIHGQMEIIGLSMPDSSTK